MNTGVKLGVLKWGESKVLKKGIFSTSKVEHHRPLVDADLKRKSLALQAPPPTDGTALPERFKLHLASLVKRHHVCNFSLSG